MFTPPFCPYRRCPHNGDPPSGFCVRFGSYRAACRAHPIQRFRCRSCRRTFSRQTFRADYKDHRPDLNHRLFLLLASGAGLRQAARVLGLSRRCTELKFHKIARHLRRLNLSLRRPLAGRRQLHFDEFETFEGERTSRPLSIPMLIDSETRYIMWAESAPIRPRGELTQRRRRAIARSERRHGKRQDLSHRACRRTLARGAALSSSEVGLSTDEKPSYPRLARAAFGSRLREHRRTNSRLVRNTFNPLFPINHEEAMARDLMGRLRRRSWLASKDRRYLDLGLQLHMAFRNLVRRRFNQDSQSPAQLLGFAPRRLSAREVLSWRQEWEV